MSCLLSDFRKERRIQRFYITGMLVRNFLFAKILVLLKRYVIAQVSLLLSINTLFLVYLIKFRPHKQRFDLISGILLEIFVLGACSCAFLLAILDYASNYNEEVRSIIGWVFIASNLAMSILLAAMTLLQGFQLLKSLIGHIKSSLKVRKVSYYQDHCRQTFQLQDRRTYQ